MVVTTLACPNSSCTPVAPAFPQVCEKGFNILSGSAFQRFFRQKIGKVFCPIHVEWGTIGSNPVFLRAPPVEPRGQARGTSDNVPLRGDIPAKSWHIHPRLRPWSRAAGISFPKRLASSGIGDIHGSNQGTLFDFKRLDNSQAFNNRRNYYIII